MKFELVTPDKLYTSMEASYVQSPGVEGDFGVQAGHMPFVSTLREAGEVQVTGENGKIHTFTINGGFAEVTAESVTILAESVT